MDLISGLSESFLSDIKNAIHSAEQKTSAEIRVLFEERCKGEVLDHAAFAFEKLNMHKTKDRNGVLIYVSLRDRQCAIIGDSGIHQHVSREFWSTVKDEMVIFFAAGQLKEGLHHAIERAVQCLSTHFPRQADDRNELSDEPVIGLK